MFDRFCFGLLVLAGLAPLLTGCNNTPGLDSIAVTPATPSIIAGQTEQFTATGTFGNAKRPTTQDVTSQVTWTSSVPAVATISSSGLATGVSAGTTTITASIQGYNGNETSSATLTVTAGTGGGPTGNDIISVTVTPGTQTVAYPGQASSFIAIGTTSSGSTENLTSQVTWRSSSTGIATVCTSGSPAPCTSSTDGLATAVGSGTATITAIATNADGTVSTPGTATFTVSSGASEQITALTIYPNTQAATAQAQQSQFFVLGTEGSTGLQYDVSSNPSLTWSSSNPAVASICSYGSPAPCTSSTDGLATAIGAGQTTITATWTNLDGSKVTNGASYTVTIGAAQEPLLSINVVPTGTTVSNKGMTGQYLAFGTYSTTPTVRDITDQVTWISLLPEVASIISGGASGEQAGLATAMGYTGSSVIYAQDSNPDGTVVISNPQTFTCLDPNTKVCDQGVATPQFATLTVFVEGENTTPGWVTAPAGDGTANLIHCGPGWTGSGGQVCTGTYAVGTSVTLTESQATGVTSTFGGWSSGTGCSNTASTCTVYLSGNTSVGAIFY